MDRRRFDNDNNNRKFGVNNGFNPDFNNVQNQNNQFNQQFNNNQGFVPPQPQPIRRNNYQQNVQFNIPQGFPNGMPSQQQVPNQQGPQSIPEQGIPRQYQQVPFPTNNFNNINQDDFAYEYNQGYPRQDYVQDGNKKKKGFFSFMNKKEEPEIPHGMNNVVIIEPKTFTDLSSIIDGLRKGRAIIADLHKVDPESVQRAIDYLSGALYALGGSQQIITEGMILFTPAGVCIQGPTDLNSRFNK